MCAGLFLYGPLDPVQEKRGDGRPSGAVRWIRQARGGCGGPQRHDEGRMNGLGFPGTGTLQLMPVVKDGRPFLPSPLIIFPVALVRLHSDSISRHESFCLIFFFKKKAFRDGCSALTVCCHL